MIRLFPISIGILLAAAALVGTAAETPDLRTTLEEQQALTQRSPGDAGAWNDLGNLLVFAGQPDEAEAAYRRAAEIEPGSPAALFNLGLLLQERGELDDAQEVFEELLEAHPGHARGWYQLGAVLESRARRRDAIDRYARAFALEPRLSLVAENPHVLESELTTESLLRASDHTASLARRVPRDYRDAERILELIRETEPAMEIPATADVEPEPIPSRGGPRNPTGLEGGGEEGASGETPDEPERRSLTGDDLGSGRSGSVVAVPVGGAGEVDDGGDVRRAPRDRSTRGTAGRDDGARARGGSDPIGGVVVTPPVGGRRTPPPSYRPTRNSTGRLDLRLVPAGPGAGSDELRAG